MDGNGSDRFPSLNQGQGNGAWMQCWDGEDGISTMLEHVPQLHDTSLTESAADRDIAAKAVAFVVSSTRKGIVPLCSSVASLFRAKLELESKVAILRTENTALRSRSTSRTYSSPQSLQSYSDHPQDGAFASDSHSHSSKHQSPHFNGSSHVRVDVHHAQSSSNRTSASERVTTTHSDNSLPEMTSKPTEAVMKSYIKVRKVSRETQCVLERRYSNEAEVNNNGKLEEILQVNKVLEKDLQNAQREIAALKIKVKELEMHKLARQYTVDFHYEDECSQSDGSESLSNHSIVGVAEACHASLVTPRLDVSSTCSSLESPSLLSPELRNGQHSPSISSKSSISPLLIPCPMQGCRCCTCQQGANWSDTDGSEKGTSGLIVSDRKLKSRTLHIETGDHIVVGGDRTGHVRYIGHLDNNGPPTAVYVGIELDAPVGHHNGTTQRKRYFTCAKNHGAFVPLKDVLCIISKKSSQSRLDKSMTSGSELSLHKLYLEVERSNSCLIDRHVEQHRDTCMDTHGSVKLDMIDNQETATSSV